MNKALVDIQEELKQLIVQITAVIGTDEPFSIQAGNWSFPGVTRVEMMGAVTPLIAFIDESAEDTLADADQKRLADFPRRLGFLRTNTIPNVLGNAAAGVPAFFLTIQMLKNALDSALPATPADTTAQAVKRVSLQVRAMEARVKGLEPRSTNLAEMVNRIEHATEAADKLPESLESLVEAQQRVADVFSKVDEDRVKVASIRDRSIEIDGVLALVAKEARAVLAQCESAYSAATSQGLAAAFSERSRALATSMWMWVVGLVAALVAGAFFGSNQLHTLTELSITPSASAGTIALNLILALLSVGAPIWFAWLATKQVGQRFRLSEDYAFKASISRAYEGYRREAARIDKDLEARLLASALDRLDELPLRLVETESHGSPWHELASSPTVRAALKTIPDFMDSVTELAKTSLLHARGTKVSAPAVSTSVAVKDA